MKKTHYFQLLSLISLCLFMSKTSYAQPELMDNGALNLISVNGGINTYEGEAQDFKIPTDPSVNYVRFYLKGGDGGQATSGSRTAAGGNGTTLEFSIRIGDGPDELPPGQVLRFVVGKRGEGHSVSSGSIAISGGGGGTGIMLQSNGVWIPLAIAGGGGAYSSSVFGQANGQGGRSGESGGDGEGSAGYSGGTNGEISGDNSSSIAGGNGGAWFSGYIEGDRGGGLGEEGVNCWGGRATAGGDGGYGCGGGGGAGTGGGLSTLNGPGAGGGYSGGGGAGGTSVPVAAGGGGSYLDDTYPYDTNITAGGASAPSEFGFVQYQFFCSARLADAPIVTQPVFCFGTENIQLIEDDPVAGCNDVSYRRIDNDETNTTGIFENLQPGQSYDFQLIYAGEVVDTYTHIVGSEVDTEDPLIICTNNSFVFDLNDNPNPTLTLNDINPGISDDCDIVSTLIVGYGDNRTFSCDDAGNIPFSTIKW